MQLLLRLRRLPLLRTVDAKSPVLQIAMVQCLLLPHLLHKIVARWHPLFLLRQCLRRVAQSILLLPCRIRCRTVPQFIPLLPPRQRLKTVAQFTLRSRLRHCHRIVARYMRLLLRRRRHLKTVQQQCLHLFRRPPFV